MFHSLKNNRLGLWIFMINIAICDKYLMSALSQGCFPQTIESAIEGLVMSFHQFTNCLTLRLFHIPSCFLEHNLSMKYCCLHWITTRCTIPLQASSLMLEKLPYHFRPCSIHLSFTVFGVALWTVALLQATSDLGSCGRVAAQSCFSEKGWVRAQLFLNH